MHICFTYLHVCYSNAEFYFTCTWSKVLFSVPFLAILREKTHMIPVSEVELKLKKVKVTRFFSLTCYFILLRKSKILTRERKDIWQWFILGKFDTLTSIKKFSLKFFLTITMFNKNANKKKHLDIVQLLNIKYVLVKDLFFFLMKQKPDASKNFRYIEYRTYPPTSW